MIRVMHVGLGPIGAMVARQIASRNGFRIVGAVDVDPRKVGRDLGDVIEAGRTLRVRVTDDIGRTIKTTKPDVAVLCTSSSLKAVLPQFEEVLKRRVPIVTTTEEAAYPAPRNRRLAKRLDAAYYYDWDTQQSYRLWRCGTLSPAGALAIAPGDN